MTWRPQPTHQMRGEPTWIIATSNCMESHLRDN